MPLPWHAVALATVVLVGCARTPVRTEPVSPVRLADRICSAGAFDPRSARMDELVTRRREQEIAPLVRAGNPDELVPVSVERCALAGNPIRGEVAVLDAYHLRIQLQLDETIARCGELVLVSHFEGSPTPLPDRYSVVRCVRECMPEGRGGGTCWDVPLNELSYELEFDDPLPFFRRDGTSRAGEYSVTVSSVHGALRTSLAVRTLEQPQQYP